VENGSLSAQYFMSIMQIIEAMGCSRDRVLGKAGIDEAVLYQPSGRIECDAVLKSLEIAGNELGEPNIGLQVGYRFRVHTFTETGSILALCSTLAEAAEMNAHYQPLSDTIGTSHFQRRPEGCFLVWDNKFENDEKYRHITELVVAGYSTTTNWLSWGFDKGVKKIRFKHGAPKDLAGYELVFGKDVEFLAQENSLEFNADAVDKILPTSNPQKLNIIRSRLDVILKSYERKSDIRTRVKECIHQGIADDNLSFAEIAKSLGMSDRSLRRTLAQEGVKYRDLLDRVRQDLCMGYMRDGHSFTQIAQTLGYNDQSAFTRAFKKWYGTTPSSYVPGTIRF